MKFGVLRLLFRVSPMNLIPYLGNTNVFKSLLNRNFMKIKRSGLIEKLKAGGSSKEIYDLINLSLVSDRMQQKDNQRVVDHLKYFLCNYDEGSEFGKNFEKNFGPIIPQLRSQEKSEAENATLQIFNSLKPAGYDMLVAEDGLNIVGHNAFQKRGDDMHVFSTVVNELYQHNGLAYFIEKATIQHAKANGFSRIRIGAGGCPFIQHVYEKICKEVKDLSSEIYGVIPEGDQWLRLPDSI